VSIGFKLIADVVAALLVDYFRRDQIPWETAFLVGKYFFKYRRKGGKNKSPLPDFFIGAHATIMGMPLITRDASRYQTYFPKLRLIETQGKRIK
jgi:hypothetical protein